MNKWKPINENIINEKVVDSYKAKTLEECISVLEEIKRQYGNIVICRVPTVNSKLYLDVHSMGEKNIVLVS